MVCDYVQLDGGECTGAEKELASSYLEMYYWKLLVLGNVLGNYFGNAKCQKIIFHELQ